MVCIPRGLSPSSGGEKNSLPEIIIVQKIIFCNGELLSSSSDPPAAKVSNSKIFGNPFMNCTKHE